MIEFDDYYKPRKINNNNLSAVNFTETVSIKLGQWDFFIQATNKVMLLISNQTNVAAAKAIAIEWYKSCIKLGKTFYGVENTTEQIYNNIQMLNDDIDIANFVGIKRTFITTFANVAKYQKVGDINVG